MELRHRQPGVAAEGRDDAGRAAALVAGGRRHRRAGAPRPGFTRPRHCRGGRAPTVRGDTGRGRRNPAAFRRRTAAAVRPLRGRHAGGRLGDGALAAVGAAEPGGAAPTRRRRGSRTGVPGRHRPVGRRRGFHPADSRVARIHVAAVLALRPGLPGQQLPGRAHPIAGLVDRPRRRLGGCGVPKPGSGRRSGARVGPPHSAFDDPGQPRFAARLLAARAHRMVRQFIR